MTSARKQGADIHRKRYGQMCENTETNADACNGRCMRAYTHTHTHKQPEFLTSWEHRQPAPPACRERHPLPFLDVWRSEPQTAAIGNWPPPPHSRSCALPASLNLIWRDGCAPQHEPREPAARNLPQTPSPRNLLATQVEQCRGSAHDRHTKHDRGCCGGGRVRARARASTIAHP